ncbi:MAG: efflux RND transporter periplasmic adaptor subunit, partial [Aureliella sp.]
MISSVNSLGFQVANALQLEIKMESDMTVATSIIQAEPTKTEPAKTEPTKAASPQKKQSGPLQWLWSHKGNVTALVLLLLAIAVATWMILRPHEVVVAAVADQEIVAEVEGTGTVTTKVLAKVGSKINGRIEKMLVQEGDVVEEGQIVAVLEDTDLRRQVDIARADLEMAKANSWEANRTWQRDLKLVPSGAISQEETDVAEARHRVTEKTVLAQEAQLAYAEFKLTETKVPTVVAGLVTKRWVEAGATVVAGQPVMSVAETNLILVNANVDQRFSGKVKKDQSATVILRGRTAEPFRGYVYRVYPQADPVTEEMLIQVGFQLPPTELQVGQWAEVYIEVDKASHSLVVPKEAIHSEGNNRFVFVAGQDGCARRVKVQLAGRGIEADNYEIVADVKAGFQVGEHI